jgi:hypothetical protein
MKGIKRNESKIGEAGVKVLLGGGANGVDLGHVAAWNGLLSRRLWATKCY